MHISVKLSPRIDIPEDALETTRLIGSECTSRKAFSLAVLIRRQA
jgi:hypothetical protein